MSKMERVLSLYQACGRGDLDAVMGLLDDDMEWNNHPVQNSAQAAGVEVEQHRRGKKEAAGFFEALGGLEMHHFAPVTWLENDTQIAVVMSLDATAKATGTRYQDSEMHLWTFGPDGLIVEQRTFNDTAKVIAATGLSTSTPSNGRPSEGRC